MALNLGGRLTAGLPALLRPWSNSHIVPRVADVTERINVFAGTKRKGFNEESLSLEKGGRYANVTASTNPICGPWGRRMKAIGPNSSVDSLSLWHDVSPPRQSAAQLAGQVDADVGVVGGGFTGLSAALHLVRRGRSVAVVEGRTVGWGGSGRNNGQVIPTLSAIEPDAIEQRYGRAGERLVRLVRDSADYLFRLADHEGIDCEAEQTGWFQPAHSAEHARLSERRFEAWSKRGAPCRLLDRHECAELLGSDQWHGGMLNPTGGHINPLTLVRGLAAASEKAGGVIYENSPASRIERSGQRWRIETDKGTVRCNAVVLATNAYSDELANGLAPQVARSVFPVTSWQMATKPVADQLRATILPGRQAVSDTRRDLRFFRYDARNRLITGGALLIPVSARTRLPQIIGGRLKSAFPELGMPEFSHIWSGYVGITPDRFPHFHKLGPGYWAAIGFNGRGVALAVSIGHELARAVDGDDENNLALPLSEPRTIPFHAVARRLARTALAYYRWRDRQPPKV